MLSPDRAPSAGRSSSGSDILRLQASSSLSVVPADPLGPRRRARSSPLALVDGMGGLVEQARQARSDEDLAAVLDAVTATIAEWLGFRSVVVNVYRPAWDDFVCEAVHGSPAVLEALHGKASSWEDWTPLLEPRFQRRGAYSIPHGAYDWSTHDAPTFIPDVTPADGPSSWHPEDALFVPLTHSDGHLLGIVSVDEPADGRAPDNAAIDLLVALGTLAAQAVEHAQDAAAAERHRLSLERLFAVSSQLMRSSGTGEILQEVTDGISAALGFEMVAVELLDDESGLLRPHAATGLAIGDAVLNQPLTVDFLRPLLDPAFEVEGCYLLPSEDARRRVPNSGSVVYSSKLNGRGRWAWNHHWLLVPLHDRDEGLIGYIWVDEPTDRLLPSRERLQTLRVFANQAAAAIDGARQLEHVRYLADHDALTGLPNRRAFVRALDEAAGTSFALVLVDLDEFKVLNDTRGHAGGDEVLQSVGRVLAEAVEPGSAYRVGGDEFALLVPGADESAAIRWVRGLADGLEAATCVRGSFGIALSENGELGENLFARADAAMYEAKHRRELARLAT
jgi:diguanylate cyclase (GGDEF)-like protein